MIMQILDIQYIETNAMHLAVYVWRVNIRLYQDCL